jgi:hypothetical protein
MHMVRGFALGAIALALVVTLPLVGCGPAGAAKAPVKGKVVASGQPVTGGTLTFAPMNVTNATPVVGEIQSDGTFVMTTDRKGDGLAIGKHQVNYSAPLSEVTETESGPDVPAKLSPFANLRVQQPEVEVKAGENDLTIELIPRSGADQ